MSINYKKIILSKRRKPHSKANKTVGESSESDRAAIIVSPAVRRMQNKTQVFPLETNAAIRNRLTHSLEVQQVGRYIAREILNELKDVGKKKKEDYGLDEEVSFAFVNIVEMSCLMHDIGNPPFGHFGEEVINKWIEEKVGDIFNNIILGCKKDSCECDKNNDLKEKLIKDLKGFDGNAQGVRLVCSLQKLNLTYSQILSLMKYTRVAYDDKPNKSDPLSYLMKKPGYYLSEEEGLEEVRSEIGIELGHRFPLTYIMEAADDISYGICDLEDAVEKGLLTLDYLNELIDLKFEDACVNLECKNKVKNIYNKYLKDNDKNKYFIKFRLEILNYMVGHVKNIYIDNHEEIFSGKFNSPLIDKNGSEGKIIEALKSVAVSNVFIHKNVETMELKGRKIIRFLFDYYSRLLELSYEDFDKLHDPGCSSFESRIYSRLPERHISVYKSHMKECIYQGGCMKIYEIYYRFRLIIDYISGMTDEFAHEEFVALSAI